MAIVDEGQTLHECDVCGKVAPWDLSWSRYGSIVSEDNAGRLGIWKVCSYACLKTYGTAEIKAKIIERCGFNPFRGNPYT